jgi:ubiquinone biosynthesis protein COQ9
MSEPTEERFVFETSKFLLIVAAAIFASSLSELISYFLLYRKDDYKLNKGNHRSMQGKSKNSIRNSIN